MTRIGLALLVTGIQFLAQAQQPAVRIGAWSLVQSVDSSTGADRSAIMAFATVYPRVSGELAPFLSVRCSTSTNTAFGVDVLLYSGRYLSNEDFGLVYYRVDKNEFFSGLWRQDPTHSTLFIDRSDLSDFLAVLSRGLELEFGVVPLGLDEVLNYVVPVAGLSNALYALRCYTGPAE